jgi:FAD/FMN-containing dehydrogenase
MGSSAFDHLTSLLSPTEVISRTSPLYITESQPWAVQRDLKPTLLIRPQSLESLSKAIAYLSTTELDFKVRSQGFGNASAKDVLISLSAFDGFEFDRENEVVTLGAGQLVGCSLHGGNRHFFSAC